MARTQGARGKKFANRFKPYEGAKPVDRHIRLTHDMLMSKACLSLSANAFRAYSYMKLVACGKPTFTFAISCAVGKNKIIKSKTTFLKARDELIKKGFIDYINMTSAKYKRETAEYMFTDSWQDK